MDQYGRYHKNLWEREKNKETSKQQKFITVTKENKWKDYKINIEFKDLNMV